MISNFCYTLTNKIKEPIDTFFQKCEDVLHKSKNEITTTQGKVMIAAGLGFGMYYYQLESSLLAKTINALGSSSTRPDPFGDMSIPLQVLFSPFGCLIGPVAEEIAFTGVLQETLCIQLEKFYQNRGFSDYTSKVASRTTSLFFTSVIFGGMHLLNAPLAKDTSTVYTQTILALSGGLIRGLAKELSGGLSLPIGIHIGNNIASWVNNIQYAWSRA